VAVQVLPVLPAVGKLRAAHAADIACPALHDHGCGLVVRGVVVQEVAAVDFRTVLIDPYVRTHAAGPMQSNRTRMKIGRTLAGARLVSLRPPCKGRSFQGRWPSGKGCWNEYACPE
jgi:hypothetical protein